MAVLLFSGETSCQPQFLFSSRICDFLDMLAIKVTASIESVSVDSIIPIEATSNSHQTIPNLLTLNEHRDV